MKLNKKFNKKIILGILFIVLLSGIAYFTIINTDITSKPQQISYTQFQEMVKENEIKHVEINLTDGKFSFSDTNGTQYITDNPKTQNFKAYLLNSNISVNEVSGNSLWKSLLLNIIPLLLWVVIIFFFMKKFAKVSPIQTNKNSKPVSSNVKFTDIAGNEEAKEDTMFIVNFLKDPKKYVEMGAKLPKGVLLLGPPGTGKTLLAKAVAGEAGVPFFSISGSDFVEMFVGVGAKRVRALFDEAKKNAPCIIFIDEIDAIGTERSNGSTGGDSEKNQTINAILTEMSGFNATDGVMVIAATNRDEILDKALTRPGRFDRKVTIGLPEIKDRLNILKVHAKNKKIADDIDFNIIAKNTIGFSGAGLETLLNEAAINAVNREHTSITNEDMDDAFFNMVMKGSKKKKDFERKESEIALVAWHEAGHALIAKLRNKSVTSVTIVPSTSGAGGVTFIPPEKLGLHSKSELIDEVYTCYGGRAAEFLLLKSEDQITTGAASDIKQGTNIIKSMIKHYGMTSKYGLLNLDLFDNVDEHEIIQLAADMSRQFYEETLNLLSDNKDKLQLIAEKLIEQETVSELQLDEIIFRIKDTL